MNAPVEAKVKWSALGSLLAGLVLALLNAVVADSSILGGLPAWAQFVVVTGAPVLVTFLSGYAAPHTARSGD